MGGNANTGGKVARAVPKDTAGGAELGTARLGPCLSGSMPKKRKIGRVRVPWWELTRTEIRGGILEPLSHQWGVG